MVMPMSRYRSASLSVCAISACTARMRRHTIGKSIVGSTAAMPKRSAVRIVCAALADANSAFDGTLPVQRLSPPMRSRSTTATLRSRVTANSAASMPPAPIPMMTRS